MCRSKEIFHSSNGRFPPSDGNRAFHLSSHRVLFEHTGQEQSISHLSNDIDTIFKIPWQIVFRFIVQWTKGHSNKRPTDESCQAVYSLIWQLIWDSDKFFRG